jgi:hypothetical protein
VRGCLGVMRLLLKVRPSLARHNEGMSSMAERIMINAWMEVEEGEGEERANNSIIQSLLLRPSIINNIRMERCFIPWGSSNSWK